MTAIFFSSITNLTRHVQDATGLDAKAARQAAEDLRDDARESGMMVWQDDWSEYLADYDWMALAEQYA